MRLKLLVVILASISIVYAETLSTSVQEPSINIIIKPLRTYSADLPEGKRQIKVPFVVTAPPNSKQGITIDGDLSEWDFPAKQELTGDISKEDLSAKFAIAAGKENLFLAVKVQDNAFCQNRYAEDIWQGDSIQFAIDTLNDKTFGKYSWDDQEIGLALTKDGPLVWRFTAIPRNSSSDIHIGPFSSSLIHSATLAVNSTTGETNYELCLPYKELNPFVPGVSNTMGFNLVVNDGDQGKERDKSLQWTPGIAQGKDPSAFGDLIFPTKELLGRIPCKISLVLCDKFADYNQPHRFVLYCNCRKKDRYFLTAKLINAGQIISATKKEFIAPKGFSKSEIEIHYNLESSAKLTIEISLENKKGIPLQDTLAFELYKYNL